MALLDVNQKVSKEAYELADGVKKTILDIKKALEDGWQPGQDLPAVLSAVMVDLVPAVQGIDKMSVEMTEDTEAFVTAFLLPFKSLAFELIAKKKAAQVLASNVADEVKA